MDAITLFLVGLFLLVGSAVLVGELFGRLGQPALIGQMLVGVVHGPTLQGGPLGLSGLATQLQPLELLATFFILMMAGLPVTPEQIRSTGLSATLLGIAIFVVPFLSGAGVVRLLYPDLSVPTALLVSLTISVTALPVLGVVLREFDLADTRFGTFLMNTSLVNELAAVTTFAVLLRVASDPSSTGVAAAIAIVTVALFLASVLLVHVLLRSLRHLRIWGRWVGSFRESWRTREAGFAVLMVVGLGAALYSQFLGLTFLVGAFFAGILITPESAGRREHRTISFVFEAVTWGLFIPLFFALVGFGMDFRTLGLAAAPILAFVVLAVFAVLSKLSVGAAVARSLGWSTDASWGAGFLVTSRGGIQLAMGVILLASGVFTPAMFTVIAGVGLLATFVSAIGAKRFVRSVATEHPAQEERPERAPLAPSLPPMYPFSFDEETGES